MMKPDPTSSHDVTRIAAKAIVSTRTVRRYLDGEPVNANNQERIRQALSALGYRDPRAAV